MPLPEAFVNTAKVTQLDHKNRLVYVECTYGISPGKCIVVVYEYWHDKELVLADILDTNYESLFDVLPRTACAVLEIHIEKVFNARDKADDHVTHSDMSRDIYNTPYVYVEDRTEYEGDPA
jgi:hypothetical protein